jgi:transcriptional regulator with XRE-family HTH domain
METKAFPVIDPVATGDNIRRLREERGMSVKDLQRFFGFEEPRAVYKWQKGETLPSVDNLYALGILLGVPLEAILIPRKKHGPAYKEQQENSCCSVFFGRFGYGGR